ncbi:prolyl 3-hydroxylase 1 isoform X2 [Patella vulgata]|uniref:prolyl 3-hydroxylase 1 isoform X2 n=1 Tax=Patella vulgata TaxID=6465 RepID=UPI0024A8B3E1|nr:prolyl 3-hydroxylase 1 isoform X2 [Patella vulgata]
MGTHTFECIVLTLLLSLIACKAGQEYQYNYDVLYSEGVTAYRESNWYQCYMIFETALTDYKFFKKTVIDCRLSCKTQTNSNNSTFSSIMMEILTKSECIRKCKKSKIGDRLPGTSNQEIEDLFKKRKPYEYLQYCYYKLNKVTNAASAAYTYYVVNSDNNDAISNIKFYRENAGVRDTEFIDLELRPYKEHYIRAMMAYEDELWEEVVEEIEKALLEFYKEEERCRAECEGPLLTSAPLEFVSSMAEHYVSMIKCQYNCEDELSSVFPEDIEDLLPEHYHYLQYTYYKILQADKASEAAASFLAFKPEDKVMMKNKEYFISEGYEDTHKPRPEVVEYVKRREEMRKIIEYSDKHLVTTDYSEVSSVHDDSMDDMYGREEESDESYKPPFEHYMHRYEDVGLKIIANGNHLNGTKRFASEGFLKDEQCTELSYMIEDYYDNENGSRIISIRDIFDKVGSKEDELELSLRLLLRSSELSRHYMQKYYNLTALYFKKTSIVCWGLSKESQYNKRCLPQEDGSCLEDISQLPTDDENGYMSVLYLKDLNNTADLYFLNQNKTPSRNVSSRCGRLVGMKPNEYHNVTIPDIEMRCGVVIKYTTNKKEEEKDYVQTLIALQLMEDEKTSVARKSSEEVLKELKKNGTVVSMTSNDLRDNKAFVADGLAKDGECEVLQKLVKMNGGLGDGYRSVHPHTKKESFSGLNLNSVTKVETMTCS